MFKRKFRSPSVTPVQAHQLEQLESRVLFTTLLGGEVFEYIDANGNTIRVAVGGDAIVELIGVDIDDQNNPLLGDLPGEIITSDGGRSGADVLGGLGGADGVELIGPTPITDPLFTPGNIAHKKEGTDLLNLQALASRGNEGDGATFGFNVVDATITTDVERRLVQLVQLNNQDGGATVAATLHQASLSEDVMSDLNADIGDVQAFAIDPTTGLAYAVSEQGGASTLFRINRLSGAVTNLGAITNTSTGNNLTDVSAMAFDSTGQLFIITPDFDGNIGADATGTTIEGGGTSNLDPAVVRVNKANGDFTNANATPITVNGFEVPVAYSAMTFRLSDNALFAVARADAGDGEPVSQLQQFIATTGAATNRGTIQVGEAATAIDGLAFTTNVDGLSQLVGLDNSQVNEETGIVQPRLVGISFVNGTAVALSEPGTVATTGGLASFTEAGDFRPMLFTATATQLIRGSASVLPIDGEFGSTVVGAVLGADFKPVIGSATDGQLFFVVSSGETDQDELYRIDVTKTSRSGIQNSLVRVGQFTEEIEVTSIAWDQTSATTAIMHGFDTESDKLFTLAEPVSPNANINILAPTFAGAVVTLRGETLGDISSLDFVNDDPAAAETFIIGVDNENDQLVRLRLGPSTAYVLGPLPDPDDTEAPKRGEDIGGLTFNPVLINPFTGQRGVLLGTDATSDELVFIDHRPRFPTADAFSIYVSQASPDASISISLVPPRDDVNNIGNRSMTPYEPADGDPADGNVGELRVESAQNGDLLLVAADANTGEVYIGARTEIISASANAEDLIPIIDAAISEAIGVRAAGVDELPNGGGNVSAGVEIAKNLLEYFINAGSLSNRLVGGNFDNVQGFSISRSGVRVLVDSDGVDADGNAILGDEVVILGADGRITTDDDGIPLGISVIRDAVTGLELSGIQGMDFGDLDFDGEEELFAVMTVADLRPLDALAGDLGADLDVQAFTVTPGGNMFIVDDVAGEMILKRVIRNAAGAITSVETIGRITDVDGTALTAVDAIEADPDTGTLFAVGVRTGANRELFTIGTTPVDTDQDGDNDEVVATPTDHDDDGQALLGTTSVIAALAFNADGDLFGVRDNGANDSLVTLNTDTGAMAVVGTIAVTGIGGADTDITGMDFNEDGQLIALDSAENRLVFVNTADPGASVELSTPGSVAGNLIGYASDGNDNFFSINDGANPNTILTNIGDTAVLGILDPGTGLFTTVGAITDGVTTLTTVQGVAFSPADQRLFVIGGNDGRLFEIDPTDGTILDDIGVVTASDGPVAVGSMDFDAAGTLFVHDVFNGRLLDVDITTAQAGAVVATEDGTLRPTVGAISFDFQLEQFLAVDNVTGSLILETENASESAALMTLIGAESDSAVGQSVNKVLIAGALTGQFNASGSVETLYAGWLLTGNTLGDFEGLITRPAAFSVAGDLRNLFVQDSIGTNQSDGTDTPAYTTGFEAVIAGKLGQASTQDSLIGRFNVQNNESIPNLSQLDLVQLEVERKPFFQQNEGTLFQQFILYSDSLQGVDSVTGELFPLYENDTFGTAEHFGSIRSGVPGEDDVLRINASLNTTVGDVQDPVDYFGFSLLAGQTVTVDLNVFFFPPDVAYIGVYDPDGRLIATDYSDVGSIAGDPFQFTADRPGEYRLAVAIDGDINFNGVPDDGEVYLDPASFIPYEIIVTGAGDIAVGAIEIANHFFNSIASATLQVDRGDLGLLQVGVQTDGILFTDNFTGGISVAGNARAIDAGIIGGDGSENGDVEPFQDFDDPEIGIGGSLGLLRAKGLISTDLGVTVDIQTIEAGARFVGNTSAGFAYGNIRAGEMIAGSAVTTFAAGVSGVVGSGFIDLIDVSGDFGGLGSGGPGISHGLGGNVRYIRVGGDIFQDLVFGGTQAAEEFLAPGQSFQFRDDSGGIITLTPTGKVAADDPDDDPVGARISFASYGIRDSGGAALIRVTSEGGMNIKGDTLGNGASVNIGRIILLGEGPEVEQGETNGKLSLAKPAAGESATSLVLSITGSDNGAANGVDVFDIVGGNFTSITNTTGGEIVNLSAESVGSITSNGNIGIARLSTGAALQPFELLADSPLSNSFPYLDQRTGIVVDSHVISIKSGAAIGNLMISGSVNDITANNGGVNRPDEFEGIAGPVVVEGDLPFIQIGEGVATSGTGDVGFAGIYAGGQIGQVVNQGLGSDIRGSIISRTGIGKITLNEGAMINTGIAVFGDFSDSREGDDIQSITGDIGDFVLNGRGGIIGTEITAQNIGNTTVKGGFGIFFSEYTWTGDGNLGNITADGYGIHATEFSGGGSMGNITATGKGQTINVNQFSPSVRPSEAGEFANALNDIRVFLNADQDIAGRIFLVDARGSRDIGQITAFRIQGSPLVPTVFNFANSIKGITTIEDILLSNFISGGLGVAKVGRHMGASSLTISGLINAIDVKGGVFFSSITAAGPNGNIKSIKVADDMAGDIAASGRIGTIDIKGDLSGDIQIFATNEGKFALQSLKLAGELSDGSLFINGDVGSIETAGGLGQDGDTLVINGALGKLIVGKGNTLGDDLALTLAILGDVGSIDVIGQVTGAIAVNGKLGKLNVTADANTAGGTIVGDDVIVSGELTSVKIIGGDVAAAIGASRNINSFNITNGSLLAAGSVFSSFGNIKTFSIKNGDLLGDVLANNGTIDNLSVTGSDMGIDALVSTIAIKSFKIDGSMLGNGANGATISVSDDLGTLSIGGDIQDGAAVNAGSGKQATIAGDLLGDVSYAAKGAGVKLGVGGDLGGSVTTGGDTQLNVGGDLLADALLSIGRNLTVLSVKGELAGDVLVSAAGGKWSAGSIDSAVLTTGLGLDELKVAGTITNSLIQVGIRPGDDGVFSAAADDKDFGEESRLADLGKLTSGAITDSIIAATGSINAAQASGAATNSSVSSGISVGSLAVAAVLADNSRLADAGEQNAARGGADRQLFHGDIKTASFGGAGLINSDVSAGVDPGDDGIFGTGDDGVLLDPGTASLSGGGLSQVQSITAGSDADSTVQADGGIKTNKVTGAAAVNVNVTYVVADDLTGVNPLETPAGTASQGTDVTVNGITFKITGGGFIDIFDDAGTADRVDSIVIRGGSNNVVTISAINPDAVGLGRLLVADDTTVKSITFNGDLLGDGTTDVDLWVDGGLDTLSFRDLGDLDDVRDNWTGLIAGDVKTLGFRTQGPGRLEVAGAVSTLNVVDGDGDPLLIGLGGYAGSNFNTAAVDSTGSTFVHEGGVLFEVDRTADNTIVSQVNVTDLLTGEAVELLAMHFDAGGNLLGVAEIPNLSPTQRVGGLNTSGVAAELRGLAVDSAGQAFAIDSSSGVDQLVRIDSATGNVTAVGTLRDVFGHDYSGDFLAIAFNSAGQLFGLVRDQDGNFDPPTVGAKDETNGVAIVVIETVDNNNDGFLRVNRPGSAGSPGAFLSDGGAVTDDFTALAFDADGNLFAVRRVGAEDRLVTISVENGTLGQVTAVGGGTGRVQVDGADTNIVGMGFVQSGALVAYESDGAAAQVIAVDTADPSASLESGVAGLLDPTVDAFAVQVGSSATVAYDTDDTLGGSLFLGGVGNTPTLGLIDPATGTFSQLLPLAQDDQGTILDSTVLAIATDAVNGGDLFVVTQDGRLMRYDAADGSLIGQVGTLTDSVSGQTVPVTAIEFNADGELIGIDGQLDRLVNIDTATATVTARTEGGSVDGDVSTLAFDSTAGLFIAFEDGDDDRFVEFRGATQADLTGITAESITNLNITGGGTYNARISTTANSFGKVAIEGDFFGSLNTLGTVTSFSLTGGAFGGLLRAGDDIKSFSLDGEMLAGSVVQTNTVLNAFTQKNGDLAGNLLAGSAGTVRTGGDLTGDGFVFVSGPVGTADIGGAVDGQMVLGATKTLKINEELGGLVRVTSGLNSATLSDGVSTTGRLLVDGILGSATVNGTHRGVLAARLGATTVSLDDVDLGLVDIGLDTKTLNVRGDTVDAVFSFGTFIGDDGVYNTDDDVITGGSVNSAMFAGNFVDSVVAAGVLPSAVFGPGLPADNRAFIGDESVNADVTQIDSAEAGGVSASRIVNLSIKGSVGNSSVSTGRLSAAVAADGIDKITAGAFVQNIRTRVLSDEFGAPVPVSATAVSNGEIRVLFSENVNSASFILYIDADNDGLLTGPDDVQGTIVVTDLNTGEILDDLTLFYSRTIVGSDGSTIENVLSIRSAEGFGDRNLQVNLLGPLDGSPAIFDRSGLRSARRDFNQDGVAAPGEDISGTILDGDLDGNEGGNTGIIIVVADAPDDFFSASGVFPLNLDGPPVALVNEFEDESDIDVYHVFANAGQFLEANFIGAVPMQMGVFLRDDQGTADSGDDTFELVSQHDLDDSGELVQAFELPETGDYYIAVTTQPFTFDSNLDNTYTIELSLFTTSLFVDPNAEIAFVNNADNVPKQLVYLNFTGGTTSDFEDGNGDALPFDVADFDASLDGNDQITLVNDIISNIVSIFQNIPAAAGVLDVQTFLAGSQAALEIAFDAMTSGILFTTVDPTGLGLDFTQVFIGNIDGDQFVDDADGMLGLASNIGAANVDKNDEAIVLAQNFGFFGTAALKADRIEQFAFAFANVTAHEIGHTLGLNHSENLLITDDPNNDNDPSDGPQDADLLVSLLSAGQNNSTTDANSGLMLLGTAQLETDEFPIGQIDTVSMLLRWLT